MNPAALVLLLVVAANIAAFYVARSAGLADGVTAAIVLAAALLVPIPCVLVVFLTSVRFPLVGVGVGILAAALGGAGVAQLGVRLAHGSPWLASALNFGLLLAGAALVLGILGLALRRALRERRRRGDVAGRLARVEALVATGDLPAAVAACAQVREAYPYDFADPAVRRMRLLEGELLARSGDRARAVERFGWLNSFLGAREAWTREAAEAAQRAGLPGAAVRQWGSLEFWNDWATLPRAIDALRALAPSLSDDAAAREEALRFVHQVLDRARGRAELDAARPALAGLARAWGAEDLAESVDPRS